MHTQSNVRRPVIVAKQGERQPFKPKAWNHQSELSNARNQPIRVLFPDDTMVEGVLLNADPFTLQIGVGADKSVRTYFKHALAGYEVV